MENCRPSIDIVVNLQAIIKSQTYTIRNIYRRFKRFLKLTSGTIQTGIFVVVNWFRKFFFLFYLFSVHKQKLPTLRLQVKLKVAKFSHAPPGVEPIRNLSQSRILFIIRVLSIGVR